MYSEALISEYSSLQSCALIHEPVLFTEVQTSLQGHAPMYMHCTIIISHMS